MDKKRLGFVLLGLVAIGIVAYMMFKPKHEVSEVPDIPVVVEEIVIPEPVLKYGLPVDSFAVQTAKVKRNQNLSDILSKYNVGYSVIDRIARESKDIFDVRRIRSGNKYSLFLKNDSLKSAAYFVYEIDNTDYVVYQFQDSVKYWRGQKDIITVRKEGTGVVETSVWNALVDNDMNPILANKFSEIFAWTIDFFGIQKGDKFKVIYDEYYVENQSVGVGGIQAVEFQHMGQNYNAFLFEQDSVSYFFDSEGKSLRKAFLKAPLKFSRISSKFSYSRMHPVLRYRRPHLGVDYAAATGTPVYTIGDGTIIKKSYQKNGGGYYLKIKHNSVYVTTYMHLSKYAKGMVVGKRVKQGEVIGFVGATGIATGPHLDFRVHMNGKAVDPLKVKAPPVEPIKEENLASFHHVVDSLQQQLGKIEMVVDSISNDQIGAINSEVDSAALSVVQE